MAMTEADRRTVRQLSDYSSRTSGVYVISGIVNVLFGVLVLSLELDWIRGSERGVTAAYIVALLIGAWLVAWGALQLLAALGDRRGHWMWHAVGAVLALAAGVLAWSWPDATYAVLVVIIGWALIVWGVIDIIAGFSLAGERNWWVFLLRGLASIVLGVLAVAWVNVALFFVLMMLGIGAIIWGVGDLVMAYMLHGAKTEFTKAAKR